MPDRLAALGVFSALCLLGLFLAQCLGAMAGFFSPWMSFPLVAAFVLTLLSLTGTFALEGIELLRKSAPTNGVNWAAFAWIGAFTSGAAAFLWCFPPPTERLLGGNDQGIYAAAAINLAQTGEYEMRAPLLRVAPKGLRPWILRDSPAEAQENRLTPERFWQYHTGLLLQEQKFSAADAQGVAAIDDRLSPQFPLGYPVWLAAFHQAGGWPLMQRLNLFCIGASALLLGLVMQRWLGPIAGLCAFLLTLLCPLHVWISRSLFAEPVVQMLFLLGIFAWSRRDGNAVRCGLLAGLALSSLCKIDALPLAALGLCGVLVTWRENRFFTLAYLGGAAIGGGISMYALTSFGTGNLRGTASALVNSYGWALAGVALLGLIGAWGVMRHGHRRWLVITCSLILLALASYASFIWPTTAHPSHYFYWPVQAEIRSYREETFLRLGWYFHPLGLLAMVMGICVLLLRSKEVWQRVFCLVGVATLIGLCFDIRNNPLQPYCMRRFIALSTPLIVAAIIALPSILGSRWQLLQPTATVLLTLGMIAAFAPIHQKINSASEYAGTRAQLETVAELIPKDAIVLTRKGGPLERFATPLQFIFGREALAVAPMRHSRFYEASLNDAVAKWKRTGQRVYILSERPGDNLDLFRAKLTPSGEGRFSTTHLSQAADRLTGVQQKIEFAFFLSELELPSGPLRPKRPLSQPSADTPHAPAKIL